MHIARTDQSILGQWFWTIDRKVLGSIMLLVLLGVLLVTSASPAVAERIGLPPFHFVIRHLIFLVPTVLAMLALSFLSIRDIRRVSMLTYAGAVVLVIGTILFGAEIKGATRWIHLFGFSLQPSEFLKPSFAVVAAWLIARQRDHKEFPGLTASTILLGVTIGLLMLQPDFGMSFVIACIWGVQLFLSGLPLAWFVLLGGVGIAFLCLVYFTFPHVASRIDRFISPESGDTYQVDKSLDSFANGGLLGTGAAQGQIKMSLPDSHADFIFAVAGEEFGLLLTMLIILLFAFIVARSMLRVISSGDLFVVLATGGILTQFALQSLIHMGSSLQLLPAKGMTLPFISYGGSSLLSLGLGMGLVLALTKKRADPIHKHTTLSPNSYSKGDRTYV